MVMDMTMLICSYCWCVHMAGVIATANTNTLLWACQICCCCTI